MHNAQVQPHPVLVQRLVALAGELERTGQPVFAAELLDIAASLAPGGNSYRERAERLRGTTGSTADSEREFRRRNLEASHAVGMARIFELRGELGRAKEMFDLAKLRAPFHYLAYAGAGYLQLRRRDLRAALEDMVQARRLNPLDRKLAIEAARIALELVDYAGALHHAVDAVLLSQGLGEEAETAARRRVETLGNLIRMSREELSALYAERATALQRAAEHVALSRARLFSTLGVHDRRGAQRGPAEPHQGLLTLATELRRFAVFKHFSDAQLVGLVQRGRREAVRHAQVITREGQDDQDLFVVLEGCVQASRRTPVGTQALGTFRAGDILGEVSFLDGLPRSATDMALEPGSVLRLPAEDVVRSMEADQDLGVALLWSFWHSLAAKVRAANAAMTDLIAPGTSHSPRGQGIPGEPVVLDAGVAADVLREQGLSAGELRLLATYSRQERFAPESLIFGEGQAGDTLYVVVEGAVRISRRLHGMGEEALTVLGRGEVFGEMALVDSQPRSADARAHTGGCTVFRIDRSRLQEVLEMDPDAARQFLGLLCRILCRRLRAMNERLVAWRLMAGHG